MLSWHRMCVAFTNSTLIYKCVLIYVCISVRSIWHGRACKAWILSNKKNMECVALHTVKHEHIYNKQVRIPLQWLDRHTQVKHILRSKVVVPIMPKQQQQQHSLQQHNSSHMSVNRFITFNITIDFSFYSFHSVFEGCLAPAHISTSIKTRVIHAVFHCKNRLAIFNAS